MKTPSGPLMRMLVLILAGETTFLLPFVVARIFRPTFLEVFQVTNLQLGSAFSLYGIIAMISYFAGGPLADRFSIKKLMSISLIFTASGGLVFCQFPSVNKLAFLYGFWGLTTILLFWAALIRATREWGGSENQGKAFGLLDSGRGLVAALLASISIWLFSLMIPVNIEQATLAHKSEALKNIILIFSGLTFFASILVYIFIPDSQGKNNSKEVKKLDIQGLKEVIKLPAVWLQSLIIICAYVGFKCTDDFSLYGKDTFGLNDIEAAKLATLSFWMRPVAALAAGYLGDFFKSSLILILSFVLMCISSLAIAFDVIPSSPYFLIAFMVAIISAGIYAARGLYFAIFEEAKVPLRYTGSAVGVVSLLGYTPDVFMGPLMGYLLDRSPGPLGHQHLFACLAGFSLVGIIASLCFLKLNARKGKD